MTKKLWKDIKVGDIFNDGSKVVSIHDRYTDDCYKVIYGFFKKNYCILSSTHLLLCDIKLCDNSVKSWLCEHFGNYNIPTLVDRHLYFDNLEEIIDDNNIININDLFNNADHIKETVVQADKSRIDDNHYWLPVSTIFMLIKNFQQRIYCNGNLLKDIEYVGKKEVFCVETDTHKFETCNLTHHNSVTLRNIIFHCLTHGEKIAIALIDLKFTEFTYFKGVKNVVAVANTVKETAEIMRIARECMYKRNQELAKLGLTDIKDFKPQKPTDKVVVAGRTLNENEKIDIRLPNGEEKTITVKELEQYL